MYASVMIDMQATQCVERKLRIRHYLNGGIFMIERAEELKGKNGKIFGTSKYMEDLNIKHYIYCLAHTLSKTIIKC